VKQFKFWQRKLSRRAVQLIGSRFYFNPRPDPQQSILVAGTARSGTTWLGDLIASQIPCRVLFEPFNPDLVPEYSSFHHFQYLQQDVKNQEFYEFAWSVFTGEIHNRWIDRQNERIFSKYRLIKEIRANLALKWIHDNFPEVSMVFIMRHPCAVVLSRMELGWATDDDIKTFLSQPDLIEDHLGSYMDTIHNAKTDEEKHAIIWCVSHLVPLMQFKPGELHITYYENLCTQPKIELPDVFNAIGLGKAVKVMDKINQPSQTTRSNSAVVKGTDKIISWKKKLTSVQITNILRIVEAFELSHIYNDSYLPLNQDAQ
jgi:hypothetical protein